RASSCGVVGGVLLRDDGTPGDRPRRRRDGRACASRLAAVLRRPGGADRTDTHHHHQEGTMTQSIPAAAADTRSPTSTSATRLAAVGPVTIVLAAALTAIAWWI